MAAVVSGLTQNGEQDRVQISVGIATGEVMAGGGADFLKGRAGYNLHGDTPLLAERIRSLAHPVTA